VQDRLNLVLQEERDRADKSSSPNGGSFEHARGEGDPRATTMFEKLNLRGLGRKGSDDGDTAL